MAQEEQNEELVEVINQAMNLLTYIALVKTDNILNSLEYLKEKWNRLISNNYYPEFSREELISYQHLLDNYVKVWRMNICDLTYDEKCLLVYSLRRDIHINHLKVLLKNVDVFKINYAEEWDVGIHPILKKHIIDDIYCSEENVKYLKLLSRKIKIKYV